MICMHYLAAAIIAIIYAVEAAPAQCSGGALEAADIDQTLKKFNGIRSELFQRLGAPSGSMNLFYWHCDLEREALSQVRIDECVPARNHTEKTKLLEFWYKRMKSYLQMLGNADDQVKYHKVVKKDLSRQFAEDLEQFARVYINDLLAYDTNVTGIGCAYRICPDNGNYIHCVNSAGLLKHGDVIYERGKGGCESCPAGHSCDKATKSCVRNFSTANRRYRIV